MDNIINFFNPNWARHDGLLKFHQDHLDLIMTVPGSGGNHQAWFGGYHDHVVQCLDIANFMHCEMPFTFTWESVFLVLYFHDIEKLWRGKKIDKDKFYTSRLPKDYGIIFTDEELNALRYIHGEGDDYRKDARVMNELAAFCHACDVMSARCFHSIRHAPIL